MNNEPPLTQQSKVLELKRFLNRVSDISLSYRELKDRIYQGKPPVDQQIQMYQSLVDEMMAVVTTKHEIYENK